MMPSMQPYMNMPNMPNMTNMPNNMGMMSMGQNMPMGGMNQMGMQMNPNMGMQQPGSYPMGYGMQNPGAMNPTMNINNNAMFNPPPQNLLVPEPLSDPKILFSPELCNGLSVILFYRNGAKPAIYANASCIQLCFKNVGEHAIRRIKLTIPTEIKRAPQIEEISFLGVGQELKLSLELVLHGFEGKQTPITLTCDRGSFNSVFTPLISELLVPLVITPDEFISSRNKLNNFHESSKSFEIASLQLNAPDASTEISNRIKRIINTRHVLTTSSGDILFASCFRKGMTEEKILVTVSFSSTQFLLKLNCDNAAFGNTLMDLFKTSFLK
jgi:hypothetical protein